MKPGQVLRAWSDRILRGVMGAALAGLFAAVIDTAWARGQGDDTSFEVKSFSLFLADAGLLSPIALLVGAAVGVGSVAVFPERAPSPSSLKDWLRDTAKGRPADVAAFVPLIFAVPRSSIITELEYEVVCRYSLRAFLMSTSSVFSSVWFLTILVNS